jgi:quinol-cytochrome oxidoreductase complex cytochrome b subunit
MIRWTVITSAAVTSVVAVVALVVASWWGAGPTPKALALAGTIVIAAVSLVVFFVARGSARPRAQE